MSERFKLVLGDWSGDGHNITEAYTVECDLTLDEAREAYFLAKEKLPDLDPGSFCKDYEDCVLPEKVFNKLKELGCALGGWEVYDADYGLEPEYLAEIIVWFLNQGNPKLNARLVDESIPSFHFCGTNKIGDQRNAHIPSFGYGLFSI